jgi:uncharacterized protein with PIN domain
MNGYPNAQKYVTKKALEHADEQTKRIWEFEAELCERVVNAFGQAKNSFPTCPNCGGQLFKIGDTYIDFRVPFVHNMRVQVTGFKGDSMVRCVVCGLTRKKVTEVG